MVILYLSKQPTFIAMKIVFLLLFAIAAFAQNTPTDDNHIFVIDKKETKEIGLGYYQVKTSGTIAKINYYDEDDTPITKEEFNQRIDHTKNLEAYSQLDTVVTAKLYRREHYFTLEKPKQKALMMFLQGISGKPSDTTAITMIHFYSGTLNAPSELGTPHYKAKEKPYKKKLPKNTKLNQYFVYQKRFDPNDEAAKNNGWLYDKHGFIEQMFIPAHFNYNTAIVILPDGRSYCYLGEHGSEVVVEGIEVLLKPKQ
ncbi:hypothetical protein AM493_02810 [Flavobacterium akiainvivens]|uniref:DUF3298 domain-containing protein n=2 Tax=Flavobacterium akiainvivens TaxID=1202724 RepID=A0A0M9VH98_9FLAO|nr:hypothetical protein AM493_02810 [Flavobacterium akiainvivens]